MTRFRLPVFATVSVLVSTGCVSTYSVSNKTDQSATMIFLKPEGTGVTGASQEFLIEDASKRCKGKRLKFMAFAKDRSEKDVAAGEPISILAEHSDTEVVSGGAYGIVNAFYDCKSRATFVPRDGARYEIELLGQLDGKYSLTCDLSVVDVSTENPPVDIVMENDICR